jgi:hypothetical protein
MRRLITMANSKQTSGVNYEAKYRELNTRLQSPAWKAFQKQFNDNQTKLKADKAHKEEHLQLIKDAERNAMLGKPKYRGTTLLRVVDGNLVRAKTSGFSLINEIDLPRNFEELSLAERTELYETNIRMYKALELGLYQPQNSQRLLDILAFEGEAGEAFDIACSRPSKPSLEGLTQEESSKALQEYQQQLEANSQWKRTYDADMESYYSGQMGNDRLAVEDEITAINQDLGINERVGY